MRTALLALALAAAPALAQPASGPASHRLLFAPTARPVPSGQWALGLTEVVVPTVATGLGGGVSLGAGVVASPPSGSFGTVFFEPKVTVLDRPGLAIALGATGLVDPFEDGGAEGGVAPYAVVSVGQAARPGGVAATLGLGARVNVERPFDPSVLYLYAVEPDDGAAGFFASPSTARRVDLVPAPTAFAGLELEASPRVTILLEAAALPDRELTYRHSCGFRPSPEDCAVALERGPVHYDTSFGTAARIAVGPAAVDLGVLFGRNTDGTVAPPAEVVPWLNVTLGLGG